MKAIVWVERTTCVNRCPYCMVYNKDIPQAKANWQDWVKKLNELKPQILDITGGEPFMNPNLVDIINNLDGGIRIGLTTSCALDLTRFAQEVSPARIISMTLSYHPTQKMSLEWFTGKALMLKKRGFDININFVTFPEQMWLIPDLQAHFGRHSIRFHIDPYSIHPNYPFTLNHTEKDFLSKYVGDDRNYRLNENLSPNVKCSAGHDYFILQPNGDVFRCMTLVWKNKGLKGNIFDPDFKLDETAQFCDNRISCAGCDMDKVTITELPNA